MRFILSSTALSNKLNMLAKVIGGKNSLPILDCFLFQVAGGEMTITASDSDNILKTNIELTECDGEGEFCIPNKVILESLKELPEQPLDFDIDTEGTLAIKILYQNGLYNFTAQSADEYPRTQSVNDAAHTVAIDAAVLIDNITRTLFATANDQLRPVMNGIYFDLTPESLNIVASDGHKLVRNKNFTIKSDTPAAFDLPKKPATLLKNILSREEGDVTIKFDEKSAEILFTDGSLRCILYEGKYPSYNSVIPNNPNEVTVDRRALISALRRVMPFASESSQLVRLKIDNNHMEVSSEDVDFATSAKEQLVCESNNTNMSIGFKGSSLQEILNNLSSEQVIIQLADPSRAGIIVPAEQPENEDILMLLSPDGTEVRKNLFVNPGRPIPQEVVELTGISDEDVKDAPTFKQLAATLEQEFTGCDFAGYNSNHFDVPMLAEEFLRAGIDFDFNKCRLIDAQTIFMKMERRNLAAAYKFYCGRKMEEDFEAHRADQDTEATYRVLMGELDRYAPGVQEEPDRVLNNDMDELAAFSKQKDNVDFAGRIIWKEVVDANGKAVLDEKGEPLKHEVFNFGKYKGWDVAEILSKDPGYYTWILGSEFTYNTKQVLTRIRLREYNKRMGK